MPMMPSRCTAARASSWSISRSGSIDARIFSIYEGTTQLQVVAAIRTHHQRLMLGIIKEMAEAEVADSLKPLKARIEKLIPVYEDALNYVKELGNQAAHDFLARRLYDMTAELVMSLLILDDANRARSSS